MKAFPEWAAMMLKLAGIANAFWGLTFALFPEIMFRWANMPDPQYLFPWKMIGVISLIFGVFFFLAAFKPVRHVMVIAIGFVIKLTETIFMLSYWVRDLFPLKIALFFSANDLVWVFPLAVVLYLIFKAKQTAHAAQHVSNIPLSATLSRLSTVSGKNLQQLSDEQPVLLIFLRHFDCNFCREAMAEIQHHRDAIEKEGVKIVLVHAGQPEEAQRYLNQYSLQDIDHISDPNYHAYHVFRLKRGNFRQFLGLKTWKRSIETGILQGYGMGKLLENEMRLPGVFLIHRGELLKSYRHEHVSDRPDYVALASREAV